MKIVDRVAVTLVIVGMSLILFGHYKRHNPEPVVCECRCVGCVK